MGFSFAQTRARNNATWLTVIGVTAYSAEAYHLLLLTCVPAILCQSSFCLCYAACLRSYKTCADNGFVHGGKACLRSVKTCKDYGLKCGSIPERINI